MMDKKKISAMQAQHAKETEKLIKPMAHKLALYLTHPNSLKMGGNEAKVEDELVNLLSSKKLQERFSNGFSLIGNYLQKLVSLDELKLILEELKLAGERLLKIKDHSEANPDMRSLQQALGMCDKTINYMYQCGSTLMEAELFQKASDVFFVIVTLSPYRSNPWIALGLAEKNCHNLEEALKAFAMATLVDQSNAIAQVHSAACYAERKDFSDALESLNFAEEIIKDHPVENDLQLLEVIKDLRIKFKNARS